VLARQSSPDALSATLPDPMTPRSISSLVWCAALLLAPAVARADLIGPDERRVPSEVVFTGLRDFPAYRFVAAVGSLRPDVQGDAEMPAPTPVREGEVVITSSPFFQELRAIPADTPDPVTDAWVLASKAPTSGIFTRHPMAVPTTSSERASRARFHVRQIQGGWISLELISNATVQADGSERPLSKVIPVSYAIEAFTAPPGWQLFVMPDPSWPRVDDPPPAIPCKAGDVLPSPPQLRTLIAVEGSPGRDGSLAGKPHLVWGHRLDPFRREEVSLDSAAVARRVQLEIEVMPGPELHITQGERYQDARGRWFDDESMGIEVAAPVRWWPWAAGGGAGALVVGAWVLARRRRSRR
jgi:hypothetical protein